MGYLKYARPAVIILLVLWFLVIIHPFTREGVVIKDVEMPASMILKKGDIINSIDSIKINNLNAYENALSQIKPNDTVTVSAYRETFPYSYTEVVHMFVAGERDNRTFLGIVADKTHFSNLKLSYKLSEGNRFVISSNQSNAIEVIENRLKLGKIHDFSVYNEGDKIILLTSAGDEVIPLIETKGNFYAKIGNETFFNNSDIENVCITGVNCNLNLYAHYNESESSSEKNVVWKYGFEVDLSSEAGQRFADITKNLSIASCKYDKCLLTESIKYYIDGKLIGYESIYSESKGKPYQKVIVGGDMQTKEDAMKALYFTQAIVKSGVLDARIDEASKYTAPKTLLLNGAFYFLVFAAVATSIVAGILLKKLKIIPVLLALTFSEIVIVIGTLAGLNIIITPATLVSLIVVGLILLANYLFVSYKFKKEGIIKSKILILSKKIGKWTMISIVVAIALVFVIPNFISPIIIYLITNFLLTRPLFFKALEK